MSAKRPRRLQEQYASTAGGCSQPSDQQQLLFAQRSATSGGKDGNSMLEQLPRLVLQQVADLCAGPNSPATCTWAQVCSSWRTASLHIVDTPLSLTWGQLFQQTLRHSRSDTPGEQDDSPFSDWGRQYRKNHFLPVTAVLWASQQDVTRVTGLGDWLRRHAASVPQLEVQGVSNAASSARWGLTHGVYQWLVVEWADAHASLFEGLAGSKAVPYTSCSSSSSPSSSSSSSAAAAAAAAAASGAAAAACPSANGAMHLTQLKLPGLGHVPAPTLAAGLAACPALQSLTLPCSWPHWVHSRASVDFGPLYVSLRGLHRLVRLAIDVDGLQPGGWEEPAAAAGTAGAAAAVTAAAPSAAAGRADDDDQMLSFHTLVDFGRRGVIKHPPKQVSLTPLFDHLPDSLQEVHLSGSSECTLSLSSLQHLRNLRSLQLPGWMVFDQDQQGIDRDLLSGLTALAEVRCGSALAPGSEPLLLVPVLQRLVIGGGPVVSPASLAALAAQQPALRELEVHWDEDVARIRSKIHEHDHAIWVVKTSSWAALMHGLQSLQQLTSLTFSVRTIPELQVSKPDQLAAAVAKLVNLRMLTLPAVCLLQPGGDAVLHKGLTYLGLTPEDMGTVWPNFWEDGEDELPEYLQPTLSLLTQSHLWGLKTVDLKWGQERPSQEQYEALLQASGALPAGTQLLWCGKPLQEVAPVVPQQQQEQPQQQQVEVQEEEEPVVQPAPDGVGGQAMGDVAAAAAAEGAAGEAAGAGVLQAADGEDAAGEAAAE